MKGRLELVVAPAHELVAQVAHNLALAARDGVPLVAVPKLCADLAAGAELEAGLGGEEEGEDVEVGVRARTEVVGAPAWVRGRGRAVSGVASARGGRMDGGLHVDAVLKGVVLEHP